MSNENETNEEQPSTETNETPEAEKSLLDDDGSETPKPEKSLLDDKEGNSEGESETSAFDTEPLTLDGLKEHVADGFELDEEVLGPVLEALNGASSRAEIGKILIEQAQALETRSIENIQNTWNDFQAKMREETKSHPVYGGANYERSLATAKEVLNTYSPDPGALKQLLTTTGAGNSVHLVEFLNKVSEALPGEGKPVEGSPGAVTKSQAERLFST